MFNTRILRAGVGSILAGVLLLSACGEDATKNTPLTATQLVAQAKEDIANKDYAAALQKCFAAEEKDDSYDEAKYCVLAAQVGALVQSVSAIIGLIASQVNAPAYAPQAFNVKSIISSILSDIEAQMKDIDTYSYKLAAMENPHFQIDDFPLGLDPKDLIDLVGTDEVQVKGDLSLNMRGTWDKSEVMVIGATINAVQGILDYLLAHKLILASTDISFDTTSGVADFLHNNPDLLAKDTADESRIKGDGDKHKGLKNDVMAALSFLVGRDADLELVAPANGGLVAAIKASAAESGTYPDQVVKWVEVDASGIPRKVGLPAINDLKDSILDADGKPLITEDTFDNPLQSATWTALIAFGKAVLANVEKGGDPVGLKAPLQAIADDLATDADNADIRLLKKEVPDLLALNPSAFFGAPKYVAEMLPYYFDYTTDGTTRVFELALEEEQYESTSKQSNFMIADTTGDVEQADWEHFNYTADITVKAGFVMQDIAFDDFAAAPAKITVDAVTATTRTPHLYYIALQDPTIGGLLQADTTFGGAYAAIDGNKGFNTGLNKLLKYYCLDFNTNVDATDDSLLDAFEDGEYGAGNKIADCTAANNP